MVTGAAAGLGLQPRWIVCTNDGRPIQELPVIEFSSREVLSGVNEASIKTSMAASPEMVELLKPWEHTLVFVLGTQPLWGGPIVKHRTAIGQPETEVTVREWAAWLDRLWTNDACEYDAEADGATIIANRFDAAVNDASLYGFLKPPLANIWDKQTAGGAKIEAAFLSQVDAASPQTIWREVQTVVGQGVDFAVTYSSSSDGGGTKFTPTLHCWRYMPGGSDVTLSLGRDLSSMAVEIDTDQQANVVTVLGEWDESDRLASASGQAPHLARKYSYEYLQTKTQADSLAAVMLEGHQMPVLSLGGIVLPGMRRDIRAGSMVTVEIPPGFDIRFPDGARQTLRAMDVTWQVGSSGQQTGVTLATQYDQTQPGFFNARQSSAPPIRTTRFVQTLRQLIDKSDKLENRRAGW